MHWKMITVFMLPFIAGVVHGTISTQTVIRSSSVYSFDSHLSSTAHDIPILSTHDIQTASLSDLLYTRTTESMFGTELAISPATNRFSKAFSSTLNPSILTEVDATYITINSTGVIPSSTEKLSKVVALNEIQFETASLSPGDIYSKSMIFPSHAISDTTISRSDTVLLSSNQSFNATTERSNITDKVNDTAVFISTQSTSAIIPQQFVTTNSSSLSNKSNITGYATNSLLSTNGKINSIRSSTPAVTADSSHLFTEITSMSDKSTNVSQENYTTVTSTALDFPTTLTTRALALSKIIGSTTTLPIPAVNTSTVPAILQKSTAPFDNESIVSAIQDGLTTFNYTDEDFKSVVAPTTVSLAISQNKTLGKEKITTQILISTSEHLSESQSSMFYPITASSSIPFRESSINMLYAPTTVFNGTSQKEIREATSVLINLYPTNTINSFKTADLKLSSSLQIATSSFLPQHTNTNETVTKKPTPKKKQSYNFSLEIEFSGTCKFLENKRALTEMWSSLMNIIHHHSGSKGVKVEPLNILCDPVRLSFNVFNTTTENLTKIVQSLIDKDNFVITVILDEERIQFKALRIYSYIDYLDSDIFLMGLNEVDIIVIICATTISFILICAGLGICAREYYIKKRTRSFTLSSFMSKGSKSYDYTLTKMPRSNSSYSENGVRMKNIGAGDGQRAALLPIEEQETSVSDIQVKVNSNDSGIIVGVTGTGNNVSNNGKLNDISDEQVDQSNERLCPKNDDTAQSVDNPIYYADDDRFVNV